MPTPVKSHTSHSVKGRKFRVKRYVRMGPEHTKAWKDLVKAVQDSNRERHTRYNPYAVATAVLKARSIRKK